MSLQSSATFRAFRESQRRFSSEPSASSAPSSGAKPTPHAAPTTGKPGCANASKPHGTCRCGNRAPQCKCYKGMVGISIAIAVAYGVYRMTRKNKQQDPPAKA